MKNKEEEKDKHLEGERARDSITGKKGIFVLNKANLSKDEMDEFFCGEE